MVDTCGAPDQATALPPSVDLTKETVIAGVVRTGGEPVGGAYVRLLDRGGEFVAEVVASDQGAFRFFAAPGQWTVRALARAGTGQTEVTADRGLNEVVLSVSE